MAIRAVLFDFAGVLTEGPLPALMSVAQRSGADPAELAVMLLGPYGEDSDHPWHCLERGELPFDEFCRWGREEGDRRGWRLDLTGLPDLLRQLALRPAVVDRVADLHRRGYRTALVTNNVKEFAASWQDSLPFDELFDTVVDSCAVGLRKPDPRIYRLVLDRLGGVEPGDAVFLDDFEVNVRGAEAFGLHGIVVGPDVDDALRRLDELLGLSRDGAG